MKHFRLMTHLYVFFACLASSLVTFFISYIFYNSFIECDGAGLVFLLPYFSFVIVHDFICRDVVCAVRKKYNVSDGCYFLNCPHYSCCPYNSNK